jgi:hypothetical protein
MYSFIDFQVTCPKDKKDVYDIGEIANEPLSEEMQEIERDERRRRQIDDASQECFELSEEAPKKDFIVSTTGEGDLLQQLSENFMNAVELHFAESDKQGKLEAIKAFSSVLTGGFTTYLKGLLQFDMLENTTKYFQVDILEFANGQISKFKIGGLTKSSSSDPLEFTFTRNYSVHFSGDNREYRELVQEGYERLEDEY